MLAADACKTAEKAQKGGKTRFEFPPLRHWSKRLNAVVLPQGYPKKQGHGAKTAKSASKIPKAARHFKGLLKTCRFLTALIFFVIRRVFCPAGDRSRSKDVPPDSRAQEVLAYFAGV